MRGGGSKIGGSRQDVRRLEEKSGESKKEKPQPIRSRKEAVSEAEHELIVRIPLVVRLRPIVVQPQTVIVRFEVENVRIAVGVGLCDVPSVPLSI